MLSLRSGDVVAFSGREKEGRMIRLRDLTRFSHVGVIWWSGGRQLLWESTTLSNIPCAVCSANHQGVQAVDPAWRLSAYDGSVWSLSLRDGIDPSHADRGEQFLRDQHGKPYDRKQAMWAVPILGIYPGQSYDDTLWFCSELVVALHQLCDVIERSSSPVTWRPAHVVRRYLRWGVAHNLRRLK